MRTRLVEKGPSWYPPLGDCPCGHGVIRMVTNDGRINFFECGRKSEDDGFCGMRFNHRETGDQGQLLCARDTDTVTYDFGAVIEEKGSRYFESHLQE